MPINRKIIIVIAALGGVMGLHLLAKKFNF